MPTSMIIILVFIIALVMSGMYGVLTYLNRQEQRKRTLRILAGYGDENDVDSKKNNPNKRRADMAKRLQRDEGQEEKIKKKSVLKNMLSQAGWGDISVKKFWIISIVIGFIFLLITKILGQSLPVSIMAFVVGAFGIPRFILKFKVSRRQKKFLEEFPDALESMVRLLKAGMPVGEAISMVSREFSGPVGDEMSKVYDEQRIGISMAEACIHAAERMPIAEMQMFATGISIQQQTGSSLSEILINLAKVIRARFHLKRKVQALSAEAKASAMIIGSLPVVVCLGMTVINPDYMMPLFETMKGKMFLYGSIGWMCCGVAIMKQMINFRI